MIFPEAGSALNRLLEKGGYKTQEDVFNDFSLVKFLKIEGFGKKSSDQLLAIAEARGRIVILPSGQFVTKKMARKEITSIDRDIENLQCLKSKLEKLICS